MEPLPSSQEMQTEAPLEVHATPVAATPFAHEHECDRGDGATLSGTHASSLSLNPATQDTQIAASLDVHAAPVAAAPFAHEHV